MARHAIAAFLFAITSLPAFSETIRVATFNASLNRQEAGLLVRDLLAGDDPQIAAVAEVIRTVRPDILLVNEIDFDAGGEALGLFLGVLRQEGTSAEGIDYPHHFLAPSNTGIASGVDLNGDGKTAGPADAYGFGFFTGQYGMALLSRFPIDANDSYTFQNMLWRDLPGADLPVNPDGTPFPSEEAHTIVRLSSKSHWDISVTTPNGPLRIFASHPTPPVFDGPEDANGRRNRDEVLFWTHYLDGAALPSDQGKRTYDGTPFVLLGDLNADPHDGDGIHSGINTLLAHSAISDPLPASAGAAAASAQQTGVNRSHIGDPSLDTADWADDGPGNLRVDYVLPSATLRHADAGVYWPKPDETTYDLLGASDHRLVWVDIILD